MTKIFKTTYYPIIPREENFGNNGKGHKETMVRTIMVNKVAILSTYSYINLIDNLFFALLLGTEHSAYTKC